MSVSKTELEQTLKSASTSIIPQLFKQNWNWHFEPLNDLGTISVHILAEEGKLDFLTTLLREDPRLLNKCDKKNQTALHYAARKGHAEIVMLLLHFGIDFEKKVIAPNENDHEKTALDYAKQAAQEKCVEIIELALLKKAIKTNNLELIQSSVRALATNPDTFFAKDNLAPIHLAVIKDNSTLVSLLVTINPTLINLSDINGLTPLHWAVLKNHSTVVKLLVDKGANINQTTNKNMGKKTALLLAREKGHFKCEEILQEAHFKSSPHNLLKACEEGWVNIARYRTENCPVNTIYSPYHPIHIAAEHGHLDIIKLLIKWNPAVLHIENMVGHKALFFAILGNQDHVVEFLIDKEPFELDLANSESWENLLRTAGGKNRITNLLILKKLGSNIEEIPSFITSADQAMDMLILEPSLDSTLLQNPKILNLLQKSEKIKMNEENIEYYYSPNPVEKKQRRYSFYARIEKETKTVSLYSPTKELGTGSCGKVSLFRSKDGKTLAVKSLKNSLPKKSDACKYSKIGRELAFTQKANPNLAFSAFEFFDCGQYNYRFIMPYFKGYSARKAFAEAGSSHFLIAQIVLKIVQVLQQVHTRGILHGDINFKNIRIQLEPTISVRFIDWGLSYSLDAAEALQGPERKWSPPELCSEYNQEKVKPLPSQDVYSLGFMLDNIFASLPLREFLDFPSISWFIEKSLSILPEERPELELFNQLLSKEIYNYQNGGIEFSSLKSSSNINSLWTGHL